VQVSDVKIFDNLTIKRVANGWTIAPGIGAAQEFVHVYTTPNELAEHVRVWAYAILNEPIS
jgi:hypothetical protein